MAGSVGVGLLCCGVSGLLFGTNYVVIKRVDTGDGVWFCFCMAIGILLVGAVVNFTLACSDEPDFPPHRGPRYEPEALWGGVAWMIGNLMCPTVVQLLGLGVGVAIWDSCDLLTGWATDKFGLFGVWREELKSPLLNYVGVVLAFLSIILMVFINNDETIPGDEPSQLSASPCPRAASHKQLGSEPPRGVEETAGRPEAALAIAPPPPAVAAAPSAVAARVDGASEVRGGLQAAVHCKTGGSCTSTTDLESGASSSASSGHEPWAGLDKTSKTCADVANAGAATLVLPELQQEAASLRTSRATARSPIGCVLAVFTGFAMGLKFDSTQYLVQLGEAERNHSTNAMDYIFSFFSGIALTGAAVLVIYIAVMRKRRYMPWRIAPAASLSGMMWGLGTVAWYKANVELGLVVTYPLMCTLVAIMSMFWGYLYDEFRTRRSCQLAVIGTAMRVVAVVLIALSGIVTIA